MAKKVLILLWILVISACQPANETTTDNIPAFAVASGKPVIKGRELIFPADHGIHPEQGIEWWYLTANLENESGDTFGMQWTLFRTLIPSKVKSLWWDNNLYFAHFAMQHQQTHVAFERFARAEQAKVTPFPFKAVIDEWQLRSIGNEFLPLQLTAAHENYNVSLTLHDSPLTFHGENGYSQKTQSGHASYYFSYPFLQLSGKITFAGEDYKVTGNAWYDREWSASLLDRNQLGWDWFSLVDEKLQNGLMLFCIRDKNGNYDNCSGTQINANGAGKNIPHQDIKLTVLETLNLDNRDFPHKWRLQIPNHSPIIIETVTKDSRNQLTISYWEGRIKAKGGFEGKGYGELTGFK